MFRRVMVLVLSVLVLSSLVSCSILSSSSKPVEVTVDLGDFYIKSSQTSFKKGVPYHFVVTNNGSVAHELMIMKPMASMGDMEEMDKMALTYIEEDELQPGQTAELDYTFDQSYASGEVEFSCHLPGHYEQKMALAIDVK